MVDRGNQRFLGVWVTLGVSLGMVHQEKAISQENQSQPILGRAKEEYRVAASKGGDLARGKKLFAENKGVCVTCHSVEGKGGKVGPDLFGVADKLDRDGLIRALLEPSADVLPGYETTVVSTKKGAIFTGVLKFSGERDLELAAADGKTQRIAKADVEEWNVTRKSLMPDDIQKLISPTDFADLVAYLETLRLPPPTTAARPDNPEVIARAAKGLRLAPIVPQNLGIERPVWFGPMTGSPGAYLLAEIEKARVWRIETGSGGVRKELFVDLYDQTRHGYIEGILGFTLHPDFAKNRRYFIALHDPAKDKVIVNVWERRATTEGKDDPNFAARKLMAVEMPHINHNGCCLEFGPDGYLYISFGDGGPQEDPNGYSQTMGSFLGKILRVDVSQSTQEKPYSIPESNPFRTKADSRPEIWALGFREPWRFTFDRKTGDLWVGDVGQNRFEEVAVVRSGENHGWNVIEGFEPFSARHKRAGETYIPPVLSYNHRHGVSVTGGYVYRGKQAPRMEGVYIFGDYETKKIWGLTRKDGKIASLIEIGRSPSRIAAFGEDADGELFLIGQDPGVVYRMDLSTVEPTPVMIRDLAPTSEKAGLLWRFSLVRPPEGWNTSAFEDKDWKSSPGGFGSRGTPGAVVRTEWRSADIWLRRSFDLTDADLKDLDPAAVMLRIHHDEDAEIFINGVLAARPPGFTSGYTEMHIDPAAVKALKPGQNLIAIHCHQVAGGQYIDAGLVTFKAGVTKTPSAKP